MISLFIIENYIKESVSYDCPQFHDCRNLVPLNLLTIIKAFCLTEKYILISEHCQHVVAIFIIDNY